MEDLCTRDQQIKAREKLQEFVKNIGPTQSLDNVLDVIPPSEAPTLAAARTAHSRYMGRNDASPNEMEALLIQMEVWNEELNPSTSLPGYVRVSQMI